MTPHTVWSALQAKYRMAYAAEADWADRMSQRFGGRTAARAYGKRADLAKWDRLQTAKTRASERILTWLDRYSPWEWQSGTSLHWICTELTANQALSQEPPMLPADSASYGNPARERKAIPRWSEESEE